MSISINNPEKFELKRMAFIEGKAENIHVLTDFDKTLTKGIYNGQPVPSVISLLRIGNYISLEYSQQATALSDHYRKIEFDPNIPHDVKKKAMKEWWTKHFRLLIKSGLKKEHLEKIVEDERLEFRDGALEFLDYLNERKIPLLIISSSGVGETIPMLLEKYGRKHENIHIITNFYDWKQNGIARKIQTPIIHGMNKDEGSLRRHPAFKFVNQRKNVLLLGDSIGDLKMVHGFKYKNLISVGFLEERVEENSAAYKEAFDVVLGDNADFAFINKLIREIP
jgi:5'-nucleotidase